MIPAHTAETVRRAEQPLLEAGEPLMLRAAHALAERSREHLRGRGAAPASRVLVLAGSGANGGDGLHAAAMLRRDGVQADAIATGSSVHEEAAAALRTAGGRIRPLPEPEELTALLEGTDLVLDAILGIGGRPRVPAALQALLEAVAAHGAPVIAVDLPSFVDATTGEAAPGALSAARTVTFGAVKSALLLPGGADLAGTVDLVDLGLGPHLPPQPSGPEDPSRERADVLRLEEADLRALWPGPGRDATKYTRGVVAIAAGSSRFPGAAMMACAGAVRSGAGMVRCLAAAPVIDLVLHIRPEVVGHRIPDADQGSGPAAPTDGPAIDLDQVGRTAALVVGPGLAAEDPRARAGLDLLSAASRAAGDGALLGGVIDAGGLDAITTEDRFGPDVVLTPHRGEAARLAERLDIGPEPSGPQLARGLAAATGATVLLKGAITLVAPGDGGALRAQDEATAQLATAGTGDVLAGVLGTLLAAGLSGPDAAAVAAMIHGRAGRSASRDGLVPLAALDVADHLPAALATILAGAQP